MYISIVLQFYYCIELFLLSILDSLSNPLSMPRPLLLTKSTTSSCFVVTLLLLSLFFCTSVDDFVDEDDVLLRPNLAVKSSKLSILELAPLLARLNIKRYQGFVRKKYTCLSLRPRSEVLRLDVPELRGISFRHCQNQGWCEIHI